MIEIKNLRFDKSILGNPYFMKNEGLRDEVCKKYELYFYNQIAKNNQAFLNELRNLYKIHRKYGKLRLFCWCAPKRCHAETIKAFLERYIQNKKK